MVIGLVKKPRPVEVGGVIREGLGDGRPTLPLVAEDNAPLLPDKAFDGLPAPRESLARTGPSLAVSPPRETHLGLRPALETVGPPLGEETPSPRLGRKGRHGGEKRRVVDGAGHLPVCGGPRLVVDPPVDKTKVVAFLAFLATFSSERAAPLLPRPATDQAVGLTAVSPRPADLALDAFRRAA